jgi:hypothetical protein
MSFRGRSQRHGVIPFEPIKRNHRVAEEILKLLQVEIEWRPPA